MAKTPDIVASEIIQKLKSTDSGLSLELGTPERKIVDAVAEAISEAYIDQYLVGSLLDVESKAGLELEQFCGIFGFGRLQGRKARGTVRIELNTANTQDINIPLGSQFYTRQSLPSSGNPMYFSSIQAVTIPSGSYIADVPVECTVYGTVGNVAPDTIVYVGDILGATSVTNLQAFSGGVDVETDDELRQRFKDTFLRSVVGTEDWYLNLCYQNKNVSKAVCFGPTRKYSTQIVVPDTGALSMDPMIAADIKHAWAGDQHVYVYKNLGQENEVFYRRNVDYQWAAGDNPQFSRISTGALAANDVVDLEFEYTSKASRNDPSQGITNKVDVYVNGTDPYTVTERTRFSTVTLSSDANSPLYSGNFVRVGSTGTPQSAHRFTRLGSTPVISFPSIVTITRILNNAPVVENYVQGSDFHLIRSAPEVVSNPTTLLAGSPYEIAGIEWVPNGPDSTYDIPDGTEISFTYTYNRIPEMLNAVIKTSKQITTDVLVHQANYIYFRVFLSVEYDRGFVVQQVNNSIQERLRGYFSGLPFGAWIEKSDLLLAVRQVLGVDNVTITEQDDDGVEGNRYGVHAFGSSLDSLLLNNNQPYTSDFKIQDSQLPVFLDAVIRRTANR